MDIKEQLNANLFSYKQALETAKTYNRNCRRLLEKSYNAPLDSAPEGMNLYKELKRSHDLVAHFMSECIRCEKDIEQLTA